MLAKLCRSLSRGVMYSAVAVVPICLPIVICRMSSQRLIIRAHDICQARRGGGRAQCRCGY